MSYNDLVWDYFPRQGKMPAYQQADISDHFSALADPDLNVAQLVVNIRCYPQNVTIIYIIYRHEDRDNPREKYRSSQFVLWRKLKRAELECSFEQIIADLHRAIWEAL